MKINILSLAAASIVVSMAFLQCTPSAPANPQVATQNDAEMPMKTIEPISIDEPILIVKPEILVEPIPVAKPLRIVEPKPAAKPIRIDKPAPIVVETPIIEPAPIVVETPVIEPSPIEPIPMVEPTSFVSSGFTLKLLKATIEGTSTLHDWESQVTVVEGKGSFQIKDKLITTIQDAEIKISVEGIKSKEGKKMDNKTYETFKSDENPFIIYTFNDAVVKRGASNDVTVDATGNLSMAGSSKPVSLSAKGKELPNGDLQLTVSKKIKMTDFNMEPPVMLLGTIKVGDEITVNFDFELTK